METLYDLIDCADLMEINFEHSIRYFGLDVDGQEEEDGDDYVILHIENTDQNFNKFEWFFTISDLKNAVYDSERKVWTIWQGRDVAYIKLFTIDHIDPRM